MLDDLLDEKDRHPKPGDDAVHQHLNRASVVSVLGTVAVERLACEMMAAAIEALGNFGESAEPLRALGRRLIEERELVGFVG